MLKTMEELENVESWEEMRERFGRLLGMEGPAPASILRRALVDKKFSYYLMTCREHPGMLKVLLGDPRNKEYERQGEGVEKRAGRPEKSVEAAAVPAAVIERSNIALASQAAGALWRWGKSGFAQVDAATFERRFAACQACPHLVEPTEKLVYKLTLSRRSDRRVCNACGCVAARKAHLPTESCPVADPRDASLNRWGEPRAAAARA